MRLSVIDSARKDIIGYADKKDVLSNASSLLILNLNSLIRKNYDTVSIQTSLNPYIDRIQNSKSLNINNLSSLCYKLKIKYGDEDCLNIIRNVRNVLKSINSDIILTQAGIYNGLELDMHPFTLFYEKTENDMSVLKPVKDIFKTLGFLDTQIINLVEQKNILKKLPKDMMEFVTFSSLESENLYIKIKETLWSMGS